VVVLRRLRARAHAPSRNHHTEALGKVLYFQSAGFFIDGR
jgi:hypothetical protein